MNDTNEYQVRPIIRAFLLETKKIRFRRPKFQQVGSVLFVGQRPNKVWGICFYYSVIKSHDEITRDYNATIRNQARKHVRADKTQMIRSQKSYLSYLCFSSIDRHLENEWNNGLSTGRIDLS